jgi:hypothetical protein
MLSLHQLDHKTMSIFLEGPRSEIGNVAFKQLPELDFQPPLEVADIEAVENRLTEAIADLPPGALVLEEREFGEIDPEQAQATYVRDDALAKGRQQSAHEVEFGQLVLKTRTDYNMPTLVAVKPHVTREEAAHEWIMFDVFNSLSEHQSAYVPLGVWTTQANAPRMLTLYEHSVQSMDNIFWPAPEDAHDVTPAQIAKAYQIGLYALGIVHGAGLVANDMASVRNIARDSQRVRFIDLEQVEFAERQDARTIANSNQNHRYFQKDVTKLITSSIQRGKSNGEPMQDIDPFVFERATRLLVRPKILRSIHGRYQTGVAEGMRRSGLAGGESLFMTEATMGAIVRRAIEYELQRPESERPDAS